MRYNFYSGTKEVACVTTYAGRFVRGVAKCDPRDEFDIEKGKALAKARCDAAVATKRRKRAQKRYDEAYKNWAKANNDLVEMSKYLEDSEKAFKEKIAAAEALAASY